MASPFEALKGQVLAVERDPALGTGTSTVALLQQWLASHEAEISARKLAAPTEFNGTLMQWFHWWTSEGDGSHWRRLKEEAPALAKAGITALWLPPAYMGGSVWDVGYGTYDLFDLGEFNQKGTVRTKYGTKDEYLEAVKACRGARIQVYADVVFNHKMNADEQEEYPATPYDPSDRNRPLGDERSIGGWTRYRFDGRANKYSTMQWHWSHFDAVDFNGLDPGCKAVWRSHGAAFEHSVDL